MSTRRHFVRFALAASAAPLINGRLWADVPGITLGVQMYMVRKQAATDLAGALKAIHNAGFPQVELYPIAYNRPVAELRRMVSDAGLASVAAHFDYEGLESKVAYAHALGIKYMVCPMLPRQQWSTLDGFRNAATLFDRVGAAARSAGMEFAFHNHDYEFRPIEGSNGFAELMQHTDPALVKLELDIYWLTQAGQDPVAMLKSQKDRARLIHLKDRLPNSNTSYTPDPPQHFTELGRGTIDWRAIFAQARAQGIQYAFVDQDETSLPIPESMRVNREYLRKLTL